MTREEIKARIEDLEERRFYLAMKDRWTRDDFTWDMETFREILRLEKMLKEEAWKASFFLFQKIVSYLINDLRLRAIPIRKLLNF